MLVKLWLKIGLIGVMNGSPFLGKLEFAWVNNMSRIPIGHVCDMILEMATVLFLKIPHYFKVAISTFTFELSFPSV